MRCTRRPRTCARSVTSQNPLIAFARIAVFIVSGRSEPSRRSNRQSHMIKIAVDAMGGDHAPSAIVDGALAAARHLDLHIFLVGAPTAVAPALERHADWRDLAIRIVEAPDVIEMADPAAVARRKPGTSIRVAADLVARREADALFSAGHTGATVLATHLAFGMIAGVDRPALATAIPTRQRPAVLLDAGANVECRP